ncbi:hypothetical protein E2C01_050294 [Portunus trituberculatus]|uniref:Uncharacterized protein n=1 Tax=Portunus trituberculatus TaxID=210409 RepID=A0A5B7GGC6_PORTR|nr:hypothetical protein [Portunus trituberculatus]
MTQGHRLGLCAVLALGAGAAFLRLPSSPSSEEGDCTGSRSTLPSLRARHKWRKPAEFDGKVPWEAYQAQF